MAIETKIAPAIERLTTLHTAVLKRLDGALRHNIQPADVRLRLMLRWRSQTEEVTRYNAELEREHAEEAADLDIPTDQLRRTRRPIGLHQAEVFSVLIHRQALRLP